MHKIAHVSSGSQPYNNEFLRHNTSCLSVLHNILVLLTEDFDESISFDEIISKK